MHLRTCVSMPPSQMMHAFDAQQQVKHSLCFRLCNMLTWHEAGGLLQMILELWGGSCPAAWTGLLPWPCMLSKFWSVLCRAASAQAGVMAGMSCFCRRQLLLARGLHRAHMPAKVHCDAVVAIISDWLPSLVCH